MIHFSINNREAVEVDVEEEEDIGEVEEGGSEEEEEGGEEVVIEVDIMDIIRIIRKTVIVYENFCNK